MAIRYTSGDLLEDDARALVNPVNCVGVMGKGLALQFKKAYPAVFEAYREACRDGRVSPGHVFAVELPDGRLILHFPTKRHWRQKSRMEDVESGLGSLAEEIRSHGIQSIAIPQLGCGLGGLQWPEVRSRIRAVLGPISEVDIRLYGPGG